MSRIHFDQDIQPLSEFRAGVASYIKQINETRRPLVNTRRGKGVAVVLVRLSLVVTVALFRYRSIAAP